MNQPANRVSLNKINIVGGGPAGLYFAILIHKIFPAAEINIYERNSIDDIEGWGIVINMGTIKLLQKTDPQSFNYLLTNTRQWSDIDIIRQNEKISVRGKSYLSTSRELLISALRQRCDSLGIPIHYNHKISTLDELKACDLLVGADGAYSFVRSELAEYFKPNVDTRTDKFMWLGTKKAFTTITHIFKQTSMGLFSAECYPYSDTHCTFIPICDSKTWERANFSTLSMDDSLKLLEEVFKDELDGENLLAGAFARWRNFPVVTNQNWFHSNVLLLGDALRTAHFSIGSGTRLALEDAIVAATAFETGDSIESSLSNFQHKRKPFVEKYQKVAYESMLWFEEIEQVIDLELIPFTFELMTRSDKLGIRSLKLQDPEFAEKYLQWKEAQTQ